MRPPGFPAAWMERTTRRRAVGPDWPATVGRGQVFILPTGFGLLAAGTTLVLLLVALNYQNSLVFLLAFLLGAMLQTAMVVTHRHLQGLGIDGIGVSPAFAGDPVHVRVMVSNRRRRPRRGLHIYAEGGHIGAEYDIAGGARGELPLGLPPRSRGRHRIDGLGIASSEPFGTFRAWCRLRPAVVIVYPKPAPDAPPPPGQAGETHGGEAHGQPEDFAGLARYRPGDRPGQIAWHVYARGGALERKHFAGGGRGTRWLDFAMAPGDTEARLSVLASWALAAEHGDRPWGLRLPGHRIAPGRGSAHLARCLRALALFPGPYDERDTR